MFKRHLPALTLFTFCVGVGIGLSWDYGLIPLTISPANSGSLSIEVTQREELPPPDESQTIGNHRRVIVPKIADDDPEVFGQQSEPESEERNTATVRGSAKSLSDADEQNSDRANSSRNAVESTGRSERPAATSTIRPRDRNPIQLNAQAGIEEAPPERGHRRVTATAHQESESSDRGDQPSPQALLTAAEEKLSSGETLAAHRDLSKLYWNHRELRPRLQDMIDSTANAIFFQPRPHYIEPYVIQDGERLEPIAKKYHLTWEYLSRLNDTNPRRIQIGQKLKVVKGPFAAVVDLKDFALTVHLQGYYVKRYQVGIGQDGSSPIGKFPVLNKVENPQYTDPNGKVISGDDPSNPLGERWIDLGNSYGIHGTTDPGSIGKAKSRGCIRLNDKDVIEVYDFLVKGSEVVIRKE